jgi:mRNA-degrading endonuclease toxin of MazEF toxin-antitoxin module
VVVTVVAEVVVLVVAVVVVVVAEAKRKIDVSLSIEEENLFGLTGCRCLTCCCRSLTKKEKRREIEIRFAVEQIFV